MKIFVVLLAVAAVLVLLDRFLLWCEERGWIYYRRRKASPGTAGAAMMEIQSMLEPGKKHVLEARREEEERDDQGED